MSETIQDVVRSKYGSVAGKGLSSDHSGVRAVAEAFGYSAEQLASIPAEANMGLSCGNPTALAGLRPGEVVVDLGSGGGLDVFLAAAKVGPTGRAIGIDMTQPMIDLARRNAAKGVDGRPITNAEFQLATIDKLPLPDASVDCVVSNCVINLAPDKPAVFREIARVLKPGGRLAVSDIALKQPLPAELAGDLMAYVGCIAGALPIEVYRQQLAAAGFAHVEVVDTQTDLNVYGEVENQSGCCSPAMESGEASSRTSSKTAEATATATSASEAATAVASCCSAALPAELPVVEASCCSTTSQEQSDKQLRRRLMELLKRYNVNDYAASVRVYAVKP